jgi:hypothetical protein
MKKKLNESYSSIHRFLSDVLNHRMYENLKDNMTGKKL